MDSSVSVIIPTYYRNNDLISAIKSVEGQTHSEIEIIVVDDSGENHSKQVVKDLDVTYISHSENQGPIGAWNTGFVAATGDYIQILDDDDRLLPAKIEKQVELLDANPEVGVAHCGIKWEFGVTVRPNLAHKGDVLKEVLTLNTSPCITSTLLMRKSILDDVFPLKKYQGAADDVLKIEMAQRTEFDYINDSLVIRGEDNDNVSESRRAINACFEILSDYESLYNEYDPEIRKRALSKTHSRKAYFQISNQLWSANAIRSFLRANYYYPGIDKKLFVIFLLSILGRPPFNLVHKFMRVVKRRGKSLLGS